MADLGAVLLREATGYALARVQELLDPDHLIDVLDAPAPVDPATLDLVVAALARAKAHADGSAGALQGPVSFENVRGAAANVVAAITHLRTAAVALGADDGSHLTHALESVPDPGGLAGQLGLTAAPDVQVAPGSLTYTVESSGVALLGVIQIARVRLVVRATDTGDLSLALSLTGVTLSLGSDAGPILDAVLGAAGLAVTADLGVSVDTIWGLTATGTLGPIVLPTRSLSPLLKSLSGTLVLDGPDQGLALTARSEGSLGGAVTVLVDGFGVRLPITSDGIGEPIAIAPDSLGLTISAGPVIGGGFLSVRTVQEGQRYSGALRLRIGPIDVKAYGVLTELKPELGGGFSLAVVLSVEFKPPIEIAFGFTVNGVGGVIGLNVRVDTEVLRSQLRTGVLERLLFPPDPIAAAPAILQTLASVFPPSPGGFVIGPMLSLGWGRPVSFIKLDLAVILALPDPTVILLARLRVAIPIPEFPQVDLKAEIYGEFSADRVLIIGTLYDSRVAAFSVSGDIGMLTRFGDDATFAISAGGFHPRYDPPSELAGLRRISVELSPPVGLQFRVEGYVALTTNTVQFGGRVEVAYSVGVAGVHGYLALDAIVRFEPFGFEIDIAAGVGVEVLGFTLVSIDLALHLAGPTPWRVHGTGRVNLPWPLPDPSISFGPIAWGTPTPTAAATVSPAELVAAALSDKAAWSRVDSPGRPSPVTLRDVRPGATDVLVDPWSLVRGTQTAVPLDTDIARVGGSRVNPGETRVLIGDPTVDETAGARWSVDQQPFPLGQYLDLPDDAALSAPSFEHRAAGLVIDPADLATVPAAPVEATLAYETSFPGEPTPSRFSDELFDVYEPALTLAATSAGRSELRQVGRYAAARDPIAVAPASQVRVASTATLDPVAGFDGHVAWSDAAAAVRDAGLAPTMLQLVGAGV